MSDPVARIQKILQELSALGSGPDELSNKLSQLNQLLTPLLDDRRPPRLDLGANAWATALLDAARHDLRAAEVLAASESDHAATIAMLLQMVFEKLAKAWLARSDEPAFIAHRRSHAVATRFTQFLKRNRNFLPNVGPSSPKVLGWVEALTRAHPALAKNGPHLEYPWEQEDRVCSPSRDLAIVNELRDAQSLAAPHLLKFASYFIENFDRVFTT
jgi:hypothetical protein